MPRLRRRHLVVALAATTLGAACAPVFAAPRTATAAAREVGVRISAPGATSAGRPCRVTVSLTRAVGGASAVLQERGARSWRTVARRPLAGRSVTLRCPAATRAGTRRRFRALVRRAGRTIGRSPVVTVRVTAGPAAPAPAPPGALPTAPVDPPVKAAPPRVIDPAQFGVAGTGGPPGPEALAVLANPNVILNAVGVADLRAGRIDPRIAVVLLRIAAAHVVTVGVMCSDAPQFTPGGSVSRNYLGRGVDIAAIDGVLVGPANTAAADVAVGLVSFEVSIRPTEVGSPFVIPAPGFFTDASTQNILHIAFAQPIDPTWTPPAR